IYFKFKNRNKKEAALWHDAGLIGVTKYLRNQDEKYTILTNDNVMKMYASQNLKRNDIALAIGLDVMIRLLTVGGSGLSRDSSEFAPLFKNIIKSSLLPSKNAFQVEDLSFMLDAQLEINKLSNDKVVEIAKIVNQKLSAGEEEEKVNLYLRREIEGERLQNKTEIDQLKQSHDIVTQQRDDAVSQNKALMQSLREIERRKIKKNRKSRRIWSIIALVFIVVSLVVGELLIFKIEDKTLIWVLSPILTIALAFVSAFPFKYLTRKSNSEKDEDIDLEVENRIKGILNKDSSLINRS
ncbi:MAG: hypothetical protein IKX63_07600, partial [Muribaculaceae bacterium]|nr:hypothetical protein [Muribaculaceae bacterium]